MSHGHAMRACGPCSRGCASPAADHDELVQRVRVVGDDHGDRGVARDAGHGDLRVIGLRIGMLEVAVGPTVACAEQTR